MTETTDDRPEIDIDGKIPCNCCNHKGLRHRMGTLGKNKEFYLCDKCGGTKRRVAPAGYKSQAQLDAEYIPVSFAPPTDEEFVRWLEEEIDFKGTDKNVKMYDEIRKRLGATYV